MSQDPAAARTVLRIAARHSDLARLQAYRVAESLRDFADVEFSFRASLGDINQQDPLWQMPEKGVFTQDFLKDLQDGAADLVVHSWKDLPTEPRSDTLIAATLPRADLRDVLLFRRDRIDGARAKGEVRLLTSSPRRTHNLGPFLDSHLPFRARVTFESVRGNIPTRLRKLLAQDVDGLIVAKAALDRLLEAGEAEFAGVQKEIRAVLRQTRFMVLPLTVNPTAAAQGALAIEIARGRADLARLLAHVDCRTTFATVEREREILASYGGGCHQKIGVSVLRRSYGEITFLRGLTDDGRVLDRVELVPSTPRPPRARTDSELFPATGEDVAFYDREPLPRETWAWAEREKYLWVARETAWPATAFEPEAEAVVWTAGLRTWAKLAARGVWVTGSAEGLGEDEAARIETLTGEKPAWVKLSHDASASVGAEFRACATYRLSPTRPSPVFGERGHFFWSSGSAFDRALQLDPRIARAGTHHACGPGLTHRHLVARLGRPVAIYLGPEDWRRQIAPGG